MFHALLFIVDFQVMSRRILVLFLHPDQVMYLLLNYGKWTVYALVLINVESFDYCRYLIAIATNSQL